MAFTKRRFFDYRPLPHDQIYNKEFVEDDESTQIVNNVLNLYGHSRRNTGGNIGKAYFAAGYLSFTVSKGQFKAIAIKKLNQIMSGAAQIRVWVYCSRQLANADAEIKVTIGHFEETVALTTGAATYGWVCVTIAPPRANNADLTNDHDIVIRVGLNMTSAAASDTIRVKGLGVFQWPAHTTDKVDWIDTTVANCKFGDADYPHSAGMIRTMAKKMAKAKWHRTLRSNIIQKWFDKGDQLVDVPYSANKDLYGRYIIRKAAGITSFRTVLHAVDGAPGVWLRIGVWSIDAIEYDNLVTPFTAGAVVTDQTTGAIGRILSIQVGPPNYLLLAPFEPTIRTFGNNNQITDDAGGNALVNGTNLGAMEVSVATSGPHDPSTDADTFYNINVPGLISEDAEYEIRLDAKSAGGPFQMELAYRFFVEAPGSAVTHVLPNPIKTEQDDDILAETWKKCRNVLDDIWARQTQILISDLAVYSLHASERIPIVSDSYLTYPYQGLSYRSTATANRVFGAGYVYPTPGASKIKCRVVFSRADTRDIRVLNIDNGNVAVPAVGETLTTAGAGSLNTAEIVDTNLTVLPLFSGTITLKNVTGNFRDNEQINFSGGGNALCNGAEYDMLDKKAYLKFSIWHPELEQEFSVEKEIKDAPTNRMLILEFEHKIHTQYANDDADYVHTAVGATEAPYCWVLQGKTNNLADYLLLEDLTTYEEPLAPAGWIMNLLDE